MTLTAESSIELGIIALIPKYDCAPRQRKGTLQLWLFRGGQKWSQLLMTMS